MAKMQILFEGFEDLAAAIDRQEGDLKTAVDDALVETQKLIQSNLTAAAAPYAGKGRKGYAKGHMYSTIVGDGAVEWSGSVASVDVGFMLPENGGWHSIFVMYGTPRMAKDSAVYNAIRGSATKAQIAQKQQEVIEKYLKL